MTKEKKKLNHDEKHRKHVLSAEDYADTDFRAEKIVNTKSNRNRDER